MTDTDSLWNGYELHYNSDARLLSLFQEREIAGKRAGDEIKIPIADVSDGSDGLFRRQVYGRTLRRVYAICKGDRTLMSFEPQNYTLTELYRTEGKLVELACGQNIVVFVEQMADGTWRVLRLYEPDGTVDVIEENLSEVAEIKIISNCEFVTMWKNPAYQAVEDANVAAIWADWAPDEPYPGREEADRISNFHEVLPEDVFDRTGVFNYYSRYRNTLSGKTVTVGCIVGCAPLHDYCLLDGTPWTLSNERLYADWEKYDMPRFWLYLPDDDAEKNMQAAAEAEKGSVMADSGYTSITLSLPPANSTAFTSSPLLETLTSMVPAAEEKTHDEYFSAIRFEDIRRLNDVNGAWPGFSFGMDEDGQLYLDYMYEIFEKDGGREYSRFKHETLEYPFVGARGKLDNDNCGNTMRKAYFLSADEKSLIQLDPITAEAVAIYTTEETLKQPEHGWKLGCNIVVFTEQDANGNWRVLRLYEPDGTIDMIEESIPAEPSLNIISNCEFLTMWENPAYTKAAETYGESIWNKLNITKPYPTTEEEKWLPGYEHFFHDVLPLEIYKTYGIFDRYVRYRNTLTGKTVTLGSTQYNCRFSTYILPDGTEWRLSDDRLEYEDGHYNMVRFWLYLPANDTDGGFSAQKPTTNASILSILHPDE